MDAGEWIPLEKVVNTINFLRSKEGRWSWAQNTGCKYVNICVDMRDGKCLVKDRFGNQISLDELEYQH